MELNLFQQHPPWVNLAIWLWLFGFFVKFQWRPYPVVKITNPPLKLPAILATSPLKSPVAPKATYSRALNLDKNPSIFRGILPNSRVSLITSSILQSSIAPWHSHMDLCSSVAWDLILGRWSSGKCQLSVRCRTHRQRRAKPQGIWLWNWLGY